MLRNILGLFVGVILGFVAIAAVESLGHVIFAPPEGFDPTDPQGIKAYAATAPFGAMVFVVVAWAVGSFTGGFTGSLVAKNSKMLWGIIIGSIMLGASLLNLFSIPHPLWMKISVLFVFIPPAMAGAFLGRKVRPDVTAA